MWSFGPWVPRARGGLAAAFATVLVAAVLSAPAAAELDAAPLGGWGVDDRVFATAVVGDTVIVGGRFRNAVSPTGQLVSRDRLAAFDRVTGELLTDWRADTGGTVRALAVDGTDVYVGGWFGMVDGFSGVNRMARIDGTTGTVDTSFHPAFDAGVLAINVTADGLYAGGAFTSVDGIARDYVARIDPTTGAVDPDFDASIAGQKVLGLARAPSQPELYVSGQFRSVNGSSRDGVAALDATSGNTLPPVFEGAVRPTLGLDVNDDGTRLFGAVGALGNAAMAWDTTTGDRFWRHTVMGDAQAIDHHAGTVYFGFHDGYQGDTTLKLLAVDDASGTLTDFRPSIDSFWGVFAVTATDTGLAIGGDFSTVAGVTAPRFAWFPDSSADDDGTSAEKWGVDGRVHATAVVGEVVIVGGAFSNAVGPAGELVARDHLAAFDRSTGALLTDWQADAGHTVRALEVDGTNVYVGGWFGAIGGTSQGYLARIDAATGTVDTSFSPDFNHGVLAIALGDDAVYAGGRFTAVDGQSRQHLARLTKSSGALDTGFESNADDVVLGMTTHPTQDVVYASGKFGSVNGASRAGVVALDGLSGGVLVMVAEGSSAPTWDVTANGDGTLLYGADRNGATAWDTSTGSQVWHQATMDDANVVHHDAGTLYFGFQDGYGGDTSLRLLAADAGSGAIDATFQPAIDSSEGVFAITTDTDVLIGGDFTEVDGTVVNRWAAVPH